MLSGNQTFDSGKHACVALGVDGQPRNSLYSMIDSWEAHQ